MARKKKKFIGSPFALTSKWILIGVVLLIVVVISEGKILSSKILVRPTPTPFVSMKNAIVEKYIKLAIDDLSNRLKMEKDKIESVMVEKKDWSDASLGCPEGNKLYAQVIVPGFIMTFQADGQNYTYHAGSDRVVSCNGN